jgi:integrase
MKTHRSRKPDWPRKVTVGRASVSIYKRTAPNGSPCFMVASYASGKRKFISYASDAEAIEAAGTLARRMSETDTKAAQMTEAQAVEYVNAARELEPLGISLTDAVSRYIEAFKISGDVVAAAKFYRERHRPVTAKRVADAVEELLQHQTANGASPRYLPPLRSRLARFAADFQKDVGSVTTPQIQEWLDAKHFKPHNLKSFVTMFHTFFDYCQARGYCDFNPAQGLQRVKIKGGSVEIYTPAEIARLLSAASPDFRPCIVLGAFAGLRSAEIERLEWSDIDFEQRHIVIGAHQSKTATRRIVPLADNAADWLALTPAAQRAGSLWKRKHDQFHDAQRDTAAAAKVKWKSNGLRHSFVSCVFALTNDAGRTAGFAGNSPAVVHKFYRELVRPADARQWFNVRPQSAVENATPAQLPFGGEIAKQNFIPA